MVIRIMLIIFTRGDNWEKALNIAHMAPWSHLNMYVLTDNRPLTLTFNDFVTDCRELLTSLDDIKCLLQLGRRHFFVPTVLLSTFIPLFLRSSLFIVLFLTCFCHEQVFGRTLCMISTFFIAILKCNLHFLK